MTTTAPTRKRPSYNTTPVSASTSREEIKALLSRPDLGITDVTWIALGGRKTRLLFQIERRLYRIDIHAPDTSKSPDKKFRRQHRGIKNLLKNAIFLAEEGLCGVGELLATFLVTSDERTVGEALLRLDAGSSRPVTLALATAETALVPAPPVGVAPAIKPRRG